MLEDRIGLIDALIESRKTRLKENSIQYEAKTSSMTRGVARRANGSERTEFALLYFYCFSG